MKKTALFILSIALLLSFLLTSCIEKTYDDGQMTLVIAGEGETAYDVPLASLDSDKAGLVAVLDYLKEKEGVDYTMNGTMLESVGALENNYTDGIYIYVYTSVKKDEDVSVYKQTVEYGDTTLTSSGVGVLEMTIEDGCIIYIGSVKW